MVGFLGNWLDIFQSIIIARVNSSIDLNQSIICIQEEVEIECKALRVGKALAVVSVDLRSKKTGKLIAQGRHTKYLSPPSKI